MKPFRAKVVCTMRAVHVWKFSGLEDLPKGFFMTRGDGRDMDDEELRPDKRLVFVSARYSDPRLDYEEEGD